jgi:hypothetical protein
VAARSFSMLIASSRKSAALTVRLCASARWPSSCAFSASDRSSLAWLRSSFVGMRHHKPDSLLSVARISDIKGEIFSGSPENAARRVAASAAVGVSPSRRKWRPSRTHNACRLMPWRAALSVKPRSPVGRGPGYVSARYSPRLDTPSARYSAFLSQTIASPSIRKQSQSSSIIYR